VGAVTVAEACLPTRIKGLGVAFMAFNLLLPPPARAGDVQCPSDIAFLCSSPRVAKIVGLQQKIETASRPGHSREHFKAMLSTINRMFDIGLIRAAAIHVAERNVALGNVEGAREILTAAHDRSTELFRTLPPVNPSSNGFDILDLLDLRHRHGDPEGANRSLEVFLDHVEASVPGYQGGLLMAEGGRLLGDWERPGAARAAFSRALRFARRQPLRDQGADYPRFMILIHIVQRASEAGFPDLARTALQEAEELRLREHSQASDLEGVVEGMRGFIDRE